MNEIVKIIAGACLKHHDSGETSVMREARLIIETLSQAGYEVKKIAEQSPKIERGKCMLCGDNADNKNGWICSDCRKN